MQLMAEAGRQTRVLSTTSELHRWWRGSVGRAGVKTRAASVHAAQERMHGGVGPAGRKRRVQPCEESRPDGTSIGTKNDKHAEEGSKYPDSSLDSVFYEEQNLYGTFVIDKSFITEYRTPGWS
ncbi:hypothetical protein MRX96_023534 [Rhipicephalus microplus]